MDGTVYGATQDDWAQFDLLLGLTNDLLPVVSNPGATISPTSSLKNLGKVPSLYNSQKQVTGIKGWTDIQANGSSINHWANNADYGICLQTRVVRALDIDVPDEALSKKIASVIEEEVGVLPRRYRPNTGKQLFTFILQGEFAKRQIPVGDDIIEFLANGQQFIAVGTHPCGDRYEWEGGLPLEIPELTEAQFESLWSKLVEVFATGEVMTGSATSRKRELTVERDDPVADFLKAEGLVLGERRDHSINLKCPWSDEHTTGEDGDGSTVWFPAGTNGYEEGHFKCLHGHCTHRTDSEFFDQIGYQPDYAGDFNQLVVTPNQPPLLPSFERDKQGYVITKIGNVHRAVACDLVVDRRIGLDRFKDEVMTADIGTDDWRPFNDADYTRLRMDLEAGINGVQFRTVGREMMRDAIQVAAQDNAFDSAILWIDTLEWDGVSRVESFMCDYFGTDDTEYTRAMSLYIWSALAGRVITPGCKVDMVPILVGKQGTGKSTGVSAMSPAPEFFTEISFHEKEEDLARRMRGHLIAEIGELRGLHTKELESIKAFITRPYESWIPKYREYATRYARRTVFIGTTNQQQFLADETGNRRWLPVEIGQVDVASIERDCLQLWAEGAERYRQYGVEFSEVERLSKSVHANHMMSDAWCEPVREWLDKPDEFSNIAPKTLPYLLGHEVLENALRIEQKSINRLSEMRIGKVLRELGYDRKRKRIDGGKQKWVFVPTVPTGGE